MIESLRELEKLLKLCRRQGVLKIEFDNLKLELGELPVSLVSNAPTEAPDPLKGFPDGELTPEQLMFYSAGGTPENDPELKREAS